ncbi:MAG: phosphotransferase [Chloroflexota bacterium]
MNAIKTILAQYDIGQIQTATEIKAGAENTNYKVKTTAGDFVARVYSKLHSARGERSAMQIQQEMTFMIQAREAGISAPTIISTRDDDLFSTVMLDGEPRFVAVFSLMAGASPTVHTPQTATEIGNIVNQLYSVSASLATDNETMVYDFLTRSDSAYDALVASGVPIPQAMIDLHTTLSAKRATLNFDSFAKGWVHCDLKLSNLLFDNQQCLTAVLDFDDFRYSYIIEDTVMALMHHLHDTGENLLRAGYYDVFVAQLTHPSLQAEIAHLPYVLGVRLLQDMTSYLTAGLNDLVAELLDDTHIQQHIFAHYTP